MANFIIKFLLCGCLSLLSLTATAQSGQPANPTPTAVMGGGFFDNLSASARVMKEKAKSSISDNLFTTGLGFARSSVTWALALGGSLATLYIMVEALGFMSGRNSSLTQMVFDIGLPVALTAYLILNYEPLIMSFAGTSGLLDYVRKFGGDTTLTVMDMYSAILDLISQAIANSWRDFGRAFKINSDMFGNIMAAAVNVIGTMLFTLVIVVLCFSGIAEIVGLILMGPFLGAVAVAFGPIFVATMVTPWTRDYFGKWVGFLVGTAVLTGVVSVCVAIATSLFTTFHFAEIAGDDTPSATGLLIAAIILMSINSLISQAPGIASALVPGSIGASRGAGGAIQQGWQTTKGKAAAIGDTAKNVRDRAKDKLDRPRPAPPPAPPNNKSPLDQMVGGQQAMKYPTLGLP